MNYVIRVMRIKDKGDREINSNSYKQMISVVAMHLHPPRRGLCVHNAPTTTTNKTCKSKRAKHTAKQCQLGTRTPMNIFTYAYKIQCLCLTLCLCMSHPTAHCSLLSVVSLCCIDIYIIQISIIYDLHLHLNFTFITHNQTLRIRYIKFDLDFIYNFSTTYPESLVMNVNH